MAHINKQEIPELDQETVEWFYENDKKLAEGTKNYRQFYCRFYHKLYMNVNNSRFAKCVIKKQIELRQKETEEFRKLTEELALTPRPSVPNAVRIIHKGLGRPKGSSNKPPKETKGIKTRQMPEKASQKSAIKPKAEKKEVIKPYVDPSGLPEPVLGVPEVIDYTPRTLDDIDTSYPEEVDNYGQETYHDNFEDEDFDDEELF